MDRPNLLYLLYFRDRIVILDRLHLRALIGEDRQNSDLLLRREIKLLRYRLKLCSLVLSRRRRWQQQEDAEA